MPRSSRLRIQMSDEEKKNRRREQKKLSMRRARAKLNYVDIEESRRKDRERYYRKKEEGSLKTINDFTPRQQRQIRKMWREKSRLRREKEKLKKRTEETLNDNTPPPSPCSSQSSFSRIAVGKAVRPRNRCHIKIQNQALINKLNVLERRLAKYRMRLTRMKKMKEQGISIKNSLKEKICDFLTDDENSRLTSGKKETITRNKVKKQIRLLNDTLLNLHKKFKNSSGLNISYETFRRYRPFWVIFPKAALKNTCLCAVHTNNDLVVRALYQAKIIPYSSGTDLAKPLCCNNNLNLRCLERKCLQCSPKSPGFNIRNGNDTIIYQRWVTKTVTEIIKGNEKRCKKTVKESVKTSQQLLVNILKANLPTFMQHLANITNQYKAIRFIKQNLTPLEGLLHIDFSENYSCKYGSEIQSAHFGGSKSQLSLHTCVYYSIDYPPSQNFVTTTFPQISRLHIHSDGPTTQYRNKTMFHMIVNYIAKISRAKTIVWHFSEAGHGKGALDGIGGCVKRTCDNFVANGRDVSDIDSFISCLKDNCKGIEIIRIDEEKISEIQNIANANKCRPFKGTFQIHQLTWSATEPNLLHARRLSCISCAANAKCPHFEIGQMQIAFVSDDSELSSVAHLSPMSESHISSLASSPETASASTCSGPRTPLSPILYTPSPNSLQNTTPQPLTPRKRVHLDHNYSNDSGSPIKKYTLHSMSSPFPPSSDESDENIISNLY